MDRVRGAICTVESVHHGNAGRYTAFNFTNYCFLRILYVDVNGDSKEIKLCTKKVTLFNTLKEFANNLNARLGVQVVNPNAIPKESKDKEPYDI
jgi:hypothetical protein